LSYGTQNLKDEGLRDVVENVTDQVLGIIPTVFWRYWRKLCKN